MQKAETLPSGNARVRVYSHTDDHGKKIYKPFTAPTNERHSVLLLNLLQIGRKKPKGH